MIINQSEELSDRIYNFLFLLDLENLFFKVQEIQKPEEFFFKIRVFRLIGLTRYP